MLATDLACAAKRTCYMRTKGTRSPSLAYRLGPKKKLRFRLDQRVHSAAAKRLLPLALGFSTGFINHLLRGKVELALGGADSVTMTNRGPNLVKGRLRVFSEDDKGLRTQLADHSMSNPVAAGKAFPELKVAIPKGTIKLIGLVEGVEGGSNDPLVATTIYTL